VKIAKSICMVAIIFLAGISLYAQENDSTKFEIGGKFMQDWAFYTIADEFIESNYGPFEDDNEIRRLWMYMRADINKRVEIKMQAAVINGLVKIRDLYLRYKTLPVSITVGHFKEPFSLDKLPEPQHLTFLERSLADTFSPGRNSGIMIDGAFFDNRMTYAFGIFRKTDDYGDTSDREASYKYTGRITSLPFYSDSFLLHFGASISHRELGLYGVSKFNAWPETWIVNGFLSTGSFRSESELLLDLETALVWKQFSVQAEYFSADIDSEARDYPFLEGYYVQASYWLTGEKRNYIPAKARFGQVKLLKGMENEGGIGALELAARYSFIDLFDQRIKAGELEIITFGLNWHQTKNTRIMINYIITNHSLYENFQCLMVRFQGNFSFGM